MDKQTLYVAGLDRGAKYEDVQDGKCRTAVRAYVASTGAGRRYCQVPAGMSPTRILCGKSPARPCRAPVQLLLPCGDE